MKQGAGSRWFAIAAAVAIAPALPALGCAPQKASAGSGGSRCIEDRSGQTVCVSDQAHRISCDDVLCFESMWTLGELSSVVQTRRTTAPWRVLAPQWATISQFEEPNLEYMLAQRIDVAFVYQNARSLERYRQAGIAAFVSQSTGRDAVSVERFLAGQKESLRLYGSVLGPRAEERAALWGQYVDDQVRFVTSRAGHLRPDQRPSTYYLRGPDALSSHGMRTCTYWYTLLAGAEMVTANLGSVLSAGRGSVSAEELITWDPEVIFVGRLYSVDLVLQDPRFRTLRAVTNKAVFPMPTGVFFWDGGPEAVLLMLWVAKTVHPDLFEDLDLAKAVRHYYGTFYEVELDDAALSNLLAGRSADGTRVAARRD